MGLLELVGLRPKPLLMPDATAPLVVAPPAAEPAPQQNDPVPPIAIRVAPWSSDPHNKQVLGSYTRLIANDSNILVQQRTKSGLGYRTNFGIIHELIAKSGRVKGMIQQRKTQTCRREMWWDDADDSDDAQLCAEFMRQTDDYIDVESASMGGINGDNYQSIDGCLYPFSMHFITWGVRSLAPSSKGKERRRAQDYLIPVDIAQFDIDRVGFDQLGRVAVYAFLTDEEAAAQKMTKVPNEPWWWYPHPMSYIFNNPFSYADHPYGGGRSPLETVVICMWMDRQFRVMQANFVERNTSGIAVVETDIAAFGISTEQRAEIDTALDNIQAETSFDLPAGMHFKMHELMSGASAQAIADARRECFYEASAAILGQSATSTAERSGSMSSAQVQERVAESIVAVDSLMLQNFRNQLMYRTLMQNAPQLRHKWPRFKVQIDSAQNIEKWMAAVEVFVGLGGEVPMPQVMRKLGIDEKRDGDKLLAIQPAAYAGADGQPSQQTTAKTTAKQGQRESAKPSTSQAQPKP